MKPSRLLGLMLIIALSFALPAAGQKVDTSSIMFPTAMDIFRPDKLVQMQMQIQEHQQRMQMNELELQRKKDELELQRKKNELAIQLDLAEAEKERIIQKWLQLANKGNAYAQGNLALICETGYGVPQDYVEAHKWWNLAAAHATSKEKRDAILKLREQVAAKMTPAQLAEAQKRASEWKPTK